MTGLGNMSLYTIFRHTFLLLGLTFSLTGITGELVLTAEERAWLSDHPVIRIAPGPDFAPFEWLTKDGVYHGMAADYVHLIEKRLGMRFEVVRGYKWPQIIDMAQQQKVDVLPAVGRTEQREKYLLFTRNYISVPGVLVSSHNHESIENLSGRKVAVVRDYMWDDLISNAGLDIQIERVDGLKFGLELTALGSVDAMVTDLASATHMIQQTNINNLHIVSNATRKLGNMELSMGVRSDWPELRSILDKTLESFTEAEIIAIRSNWIKFNKPAFWRDQNFWYSMLAALGIVLTLFSGFIIWNHMLRKEVEARTSELQTAQKKLMQAEKMESIGRLAAGVAHEVKNPLTIIQMGIDYLSQEIPEDEVSIGVIKDIDDAVRRADAVIYGLLDFSRDKKLELKPGSINDVITSALHLVDHELRLRNISCQSFLAERMPTIPLDNNKLQQVFINLIMNATHAMEHNGELRITTEVRKLGKVVDLACDSEGLFRPGETVIWVEVADTGPGISAQDKAKIFELFYTTEALGEGTGLGLSVSRNIINLHNGTIDINNRPEGGASVVILFKLNKR